MSLLIWLPLIGNLNSQGTDNVTFSYVNNNGKLAVNNNGKIGKCYERTASGYADCYRSSKNYNLSGDITMACWAYVSSTIGDTANGLITNHNHADCSGVGITVKQASASDYRISCNTGSGGSSRTYCTYYGTSNIKDKWCHLALTYSKSAKQLKLWVNGNCEYTLNNYTNYAASNPFDLFNWSTGHYTYGDYRPVCKLNDVRVYDECLSTKEVQLIARGLVGHYPLDNSGSGNSNLARGTATMPNGTGAWSTGTFRNSNTGASYSQDMPSDAPFAKGIKLTTSSSNTMPGFAQDGAPIKTGYITESYWIKAPAGGYATVQPCWKSGVSFTVVSGKSTWTTTGEWQKVYCTYQVTTNHDSISIAYAYFTAKTAGDVAYVCGMKIEQGNSLIPTSWCPNENDTEYTSMGFNSLITYDTSGYGYNGTKTKAMTYDSSTARYQSSTNFDGNTDSILIPFNTMLGLATSSDYTISVWTYKSSIGTKNYQTIFGGPGGFELEARNSSGSDPLYVLWNWGKGSAAYSFNTWTHFCFVHTTSNCKMYVNGVLKVTGNTASIPSGNYYIGSWNTTSSQNYEGKMSDFRIYATALSADAVKELYSMGTSIANTSKLLAYDFIEV